MTSTEVAEVQMTLSDALAQLEGAGALTPTSLDLTDPDMPYETWESLGRLFGVIDRGSRWWIGDWLNFGESVYGEQAAQGIDDTTKTQYDEAERVTGLDRDTLINIRSICGKVARDRRRSELGFWIHQEVSALEPDDQTYWLQKAIDDGLTKSALRVEIRLWKNPPSEEAEPEGESAGEGGPSISERIENAARAVLAQAQVTSDGDYLVPPEPMAQLRALLGGE